MRHAWTLLPLLAVLGLAACAPTVVGSRSTPLDLAQERSILTTPGSTVYARVTYPPGSFDFPADAFRGRLAVPVGVDGSGIRITSAIELIDVVAPDGWRWIVDDVWSVTRSGRAPSLDVTLRLDVPEGSRLGGQSLRGTLWARATGARESVSMVVQVVARR